MNRREFLKRVGAGIAAASFLPAAVFSKTITPPFKAYIGTYTRGDSKGIYVCDWNFYTGELGTPEVTAETVSPSFLACHPNGRTLYAVNETGDFKGSRNGGISAFSVDKRSGKLTLINDRLSGGSGPCHLVVDATGKHVLAANYGGGSVISLPIRKDGGLGERTSFIQHEGSSVNSRRQKGPHGHSINLDPNSNKMAMVADLGMDKVMAYRFDMISGALTPASKPFVKTRSGGGPRHLAFHPRGRFVYTNLELFSSVTVLAYDRASGGLKELQTVSTLPAGYSGQNSTAEVQVHKSGKFLYCSNRGHNSIAVFSVDNLSGKLEPIERVGTGGEVPRNFEIDPTGRFLLAANQKTNNVVVFRIDQETGRLNATGQSIEVATPVCVKFLRE